MKISSAENMINGIVQTQADWEQQYQQGAWAHLHSDSEYSHYALIAACIERVGRPIDLLDVGCGEGVVLKYLSQSRISRYTGIDISNAALSKIELRRPQDEFFCSTIEAFNPPQGARYDVILFNEVLYYTKDPVVQLQKLMSALSRDGIAVISMYRKRNPFSWNNRCIRSVRRHLFTSSCVIIEDLLLTQRSSGLSWAVVVVRAK